MWLVAPMITILSITYVVDPRGGFGRLRVCFSYILIKWGRYFRHCSINGGHVVILCAQHFCAFSIVWRCHSCPFVWHSCSFFVHHSCVFLIYINDCFRDCYWGWHKFNVAIVIIIVIFIVPIIIVIIIIVINKILVGLVCQVRVLILVSCIIVSYNFWSYSASTVAGDISIYHR